MFTSFYSFSLFLNIAVSLRGVEVEGGCRKIYGDYGIYVVWLRGDVRGVKLPT